MQRNGTQQRLIRNPHARRSLPYIMCEDNIAQNRVTAKLDLFALLI